MMRKAQKGDAETLTKLSFDSKRYWKYPIEYFKIWEPELTISPKYINKNLVFVFEEQGIIKGYYSVVQIEHDQHMLGDVLKKGAWLEHMFINPMHIKKGIGTKMFLHIEDVCRKNLISALGILSDPNSKGFYEKMGCKYVKEFPSTIENRTTPMLTYEIKKRLRVHATITSYFE